MLKKELIDYLTNARAIPDDAEVVLHFPGQPHFPRFNRDNVLFVIDDCAQGEPGGLG